MEAAVAVAAAAAADPSSSSSSSSGIIFRLLPDELLERVFCFLPLPNVFVYRLVCKHWNGLLRSHAFLATFDVCNHRFVRLWITFFDGLHLVDQRSILLYDPPLQRWRRLSLAFLPSRYNIAIAAAGGLFCVAGNSFVDDERSREQNVMAICNPFTKVYKELPPLQLDLVEAHAIMEQRENGSYRVYVMSSGLMAVYDSGNDYWLNMNMGEKVRPRSPVICQGAMYGLRDDGSLWWHSWKLVASDLKVLTRADEGASNGLYAGNCNWAVVNQSGGDGFAALIRRPRLLGADGCLLLVGGLKKSNLSYSCSTFVIYKLDFMTLEWLEVARMPQNLYWGFQDLATVKIFGSVRDVFFFCENTHSIVACNLSNEVVWQRVVNCPDLTYCISALFKGFTYNVKLGSAV